MTDDVKSRSEHLDQIPGIDGLRAVSIVLVLVFHAFPAALPGGFIGVDVFFVISGFLITRLIVEGIDARSFTISGFYLRRARRLLPTLGVVCLATYLGALWLHLPDALVGFGDSLAAASAFVSNIYFYQTIDYFSGPAYTRPLLHTWSLAVEEQFYIVWPLLMLAFWRRLGARRVSIAILAVAAVSLLHAEHMSRTQERFAFFMATTRAWELLAGAALAIWIRFRPAPSRVLADAAGGAGLAAILASAFLISSGSIFPGLVALPLCLGTVAVLYACHSGASATSRVLSLAPMRHVGQISYALYLWHWPILSLAHYAWERAPTAWEAAALLALAVVLADLTWRFVEQPVRQGRLAFAEGCGAVRPLMPYAASLLVLAGLGGIIRLGEGWPSRLDVAAEQVWRQMTSRNAFRGACDGTENILRNHDVCGLGVPSKVPGQFDVLLIGDSNAEHLVPLVQLYAKERRLSARQATRNSCSALFGQDRPGASANNRRRCREFQNAVLSLIETQRGLKLVVISHAWHRFDGVSTDNGVGQGVMGVDSSRGSGDLAYFLDRTLRLLDERGIKVLIVGPIPFLHDLPFKCVIGEARAGRDGSQCRVPRSSLLADPVRAEEVLSRTASGRASTTLVLPSRVMCGADHCLVAKEGTILYGDGEHLNARSAELLYRLLAPWPE